MQRKKLSRPLLVIVTLAVVVAGLAFAFWPRPTMVDIGEVTRGEMMLTIDEEGRTRVREAFVVSTPIDGRLLRVEVEPGDPVQKGATVVARMRPANPAALDVRTREQALAAVEAAEAALRVAEADLEAARADSDLAAAELDRTRRLADRGTVSDAALDRVRGAARAAEARLHTAEAAIQQRKAELQSAQAQLIGFDDRGLLSALETQLGDEMPIYAPAGGVILRVIHQDETTLAAGSPILEIGDIQQDLELVVELISSDAVKVARGDPVIVENWGGAPTMSGTVTRIEPFARTKVSALGVEEQRVTVVASLATPPQRRAGLGHGFSVEVRIVIWQADDVLKVPSSAVFRSGEHTAVFAVDDGRSVLREVEIGTNNGREAEVLGGLEEGDRVVLYPPADLSNGMAVVQRVIAE
jgi:HlyD family secretion protein